MEFCGIFRYLRFFMSRNLSVLPISNQKYQKFQKWLFITWNRYHFWNFHGKETQIDTHITDFIDTLTDVKIDIKILELSWNNAWTRERVSLWLHQKLKITNFTGNTARTAKAKLYFWLEGCVKFVYFLFGNALL